MRRLSEYLPKCSLVVYDQPLLIRLLDHCAKAGVEEVFLSTNQRFDELIQSICKPLSDRFNFHFCVDRSMQGPVLPMLEIIRTIGPKKILFLLADIYSEQDKFFQTLATKNWDNEVVLQVFHQPDANQIPSLCHAVTKGKKVEQLIEKPTPEEIRGELCWTGFAQLPPCFYDFFNEPVNFSLSGLSQHVGELFEIFRRKGGEVIQLLENGSVVNISTPDDLMLANALELRRVGIMRPHEKSSILKQLRKIYK
jgi:NDP-sugar pyrophosphorylase family protein